MDGLSAWFPDGKREEVSHWTDGNRHGQREVWFPDGKQKEVSNWNEGNAHGRSEAWFPDGKQKEVSHRKEGKLHGRYEHGSPMGAGRSHTGRRGSSMDAPSSGFPMGNRRKSRIGETISAMGTFTVPESRPGIGMEPRFRKRSGRSSFRSLRINSVAPRRFVPLPRWCWSLPNLFFSDTRLSASPVSQSFPSPFLRLPSLTPASPLVAIPQSLLHHHPCIWGAWPHHTTTPRVENETAC